MYWGLLHSYKTVVITPSAPPAASLATTAIDTSTTLWASTNWFSF